MNTNFIYLLILFNVLCQYSIGDILTADIDSVRTNSISYSWTVGGSPGSGFTHYYNDVPFGDINCNDINARACTMTGLEDNKNYELKICQTSMTGVVCTYSILLSTSTVKNFVFSSIPSITNIGENQMTFTWSTEDGYQLGTYTYTVNANTTALVTNMPAQNFVTNTYSTTSLTPGTTYNMALLVSNDDDVIQQSWLVQTYMTPPTFITVKIASTRYLTIRYNTIGGFVGENIYTVSNGGNPIPGCINTASEECTLNGLSPGTSYTINIQTINTKESNYGTSISTLGAVSGVTILVLKQTASTIDISFNSQNGVPLSTLYTVSRNGTNVQGCINISTKICNITNLIPFTSYDIRVAASNDGDIASASTLAKTIKGVEITHIFLISRNYSSLSVAFDSQYGAPFPTTYTISVNGSNAPGCIGISTKNCTIISLQPSTIYEIGVTATNQANSVQTFAKFTTEDLGSVNIDVIQLSNQTLFIDYTTDFGVPGISLYNVFINGSLIPSCTNILEIRCIYSPFQYGNIYEITVTVLYDGYTLNSTEMFTMYTYPTFPNFNGTSTISSISVVWDPSQGGHPNSTCYNIYISFDNISFVDGCMNISNNDPLSCTLSSLVQNTTYFIQLSVFNSAFLQINKILPFTTKISGNHNCIDKSGSECNRNGMCNNGVCNCRKGWTGLYCDLPNNDNGKPTITPNPNDPGIQIDHKGILYKFSINQIKERDTLDKIVKTLNTSSINWKLTANTERNITDFLNNKVTERSWGYSTISSGVFYKSVDIQFYQYVSIEGITENDFYQYEYADQIYSIKLGAFKYALNISYWSFESSLNTMELTSSITSPIGGSCDNGNSISLNEQEGEQQGIHIQDSNGNSILGRLNKRIILDEIPRIITHKTIKNEVNEYEITSIVPHFINRLYYDPDFESLLTVTEPAKCSAKKDNKWKIIVGVVVGGVLGIALIGALAFLYHKKKIFSKNEKKLAAKLKKLNK